jgi:hypothetical protein
MLLNCDIGLDLDSRERTVTSLSQYCCFLFHASIDAIEQIAFLELLVLLLLAFYFGFFASLASWLG